MFERLDEKLKAALAAVQKPGRYTGGEPGCVYKEKEKLDLRFAFCFPDTYEVGMSFLGMKILYEILTWRTFRFMQRTEGRMRRSLWRAARACATLSRWRIFLT